MLSDIAKFINGELYGNDMIVSNFSIDSRTIRKDDVFLGNKFFSQIDIKCFNLITAGLYYINRLLGINIPIKPLHKLDELLLKIPIIKWQGFKTVVVYRK